MILAAHREPGHTEGGILIAATRAGVQVGSGSLLLWVPRGLSLGWSSNCAAVGRVQLPVPYGQSRQIERRIALECDPVSRALANSRQSLALNSPLTVEPSECWDHLGGIETRDRRVRAMESTRSLPIEAAPGESTVACRQHHWFRMKQPTASQAPIEPARAISRSWQIAVRAHRYARRAVQLNEARSGAKIHLMDNSSGLASLISAGTGK